MAIPAFDEHGNLSPGVHESTWGEVAARFGGTPDRQRLLAGLRAALDQLAACGCRRAWLDGSFITAVETVEGRSPRDVDVCWDIAGVDLARLTAVAPEFHPVHGSRAASARRFGGDYFPVMEPLAPGLVADFQQDRQGRRKGIVRLTLAGGGGTG
jgi:hypothetical protein